MKNVFALLLIPGTFITTKDRSHLVPTASSVTPTHDINGNSVAVVQLLRCVRLFATPWTTAHQASLSFTISWSFFKLMSIESVMPSNHFILCCPLLLLPSIFPSIRVFSNDPVFTSGGQSIGVSASASVLPMNIPMEYYSAI